MVESEQEQIPEELVKKYGVTKGIPKRQIPVEFMEETPTEEVSEEETKMSDLVLRLEKIDGKLEILDRTRNDVNDRMTQLAEEIGELRTMMMERERTFDKVKSQFDIVKESVTDIRPERLAKKFEKTEKDILESKAKIETLETIIKELAEENRRFRRLMEKIKSFENLVDISYEMERKLSRINEIRNYADVVVAKVENIFSELNEKVSQLESQKEKIEKLDELTIEITKMLDEVSIKMTKFVTEKDLADFKKSLEEDLAKIPKGNGQTVQVTGDQWVKDSITELTNRISKLKSVVQSQNEVLNNLIDRIENTAKETS
jgi:chromosome segregation ATPase